MNNIGDTVVLYICLGITVLAIVGWVAVTLLTIFKGIRYVFECKHRFALQDMKRISDDEDSPERISWACWKCGKEFRANCGLDIYRHGGADNSKGQTTKTP